MQITREMGVGYLGKEAVVLGWNVDAANGTGAANDGELDSAWGRETRVLHENKHSRKRDLGESP